jgi:hypothetical protein
MQTPIVVANIAIVVLAFKTLSLFLNPGFYQEIIKEYAKNKLCIIFG